MEKTFINVVATMVPNQALSEVPKENVVNMAHSIQSPYMEITRLKMKMEQIRKQVTIPIIDTLPFDYFLSSAQVAKKDLYIVPL